MYYFTFRHGTSSGFAGASESGQKDELHDHAFLKKAGIAPGFFKAFSMENNIHCMCSEYKPAEDFHLHKMPQDHEFFILRIDEVCQGGDKLPANGSTKYNSDATTNAPSLLMLSSLNEFSFFASKDSHVRTLEIFIPRRWFFSQLNIECPYGLLKKYMMIRSRKAQMDAGNPVLKNLFLEIIKEAGKGAVDFVFVEKKVKLLLDIFFTDISARLHDFLESERVKISKDEINRLMTVKKYLDAATPPPTFVSLTKIALMSSTSLKTKFKKMYGTTVFEYFQSVRMQRARILLLTHKYSVKQIGHELGYSNLSNFTIAFKKEFNQLPHKLIR